MAGVFSASGLPRRSSTTAAHMITAAPLPRPAINRQVVPVGEPSKPGVEVCVVTGESYDFSFFRAGLPPLCPVSCFHISQNAAGPDSVCDVPPVIRDSTFFFPPVHP